MGIGVLGPLTLNGSVRIAPRDRVVLQALAVRVGEYVDSDVLADALWGEQPPASWPKIVQGCVSRLRKALGPDLIETSPYGYRLVVDPDGLDAATFERLLTNARNHLEAGDADRAAYVIGEGLSLWRGRAFPDLEEWEPGRAEIARLQGLRMDAQELAVSADIERGRSGAVLEEARRLVSAAPYREQRWALCARALYQSGRQAEALEVLHRARQRLREELGLDPGPALVQLEESILRQDPALAPTDAVDTSSVCPYRGLLAYEPQDSEAFFGREAEIGACLERLREAGVLAVVGPSGSGKSSLVRAGVVAALQRAGQSVVITTPGSRPLDSLGGVPRRGHPVLVVDQAEEALTLCPDPIERVRYFESLAAHEGPVVIALRADRLGDLPEYRDFARLVERGLYLLGGLGEQSMREAIEGPATQAGLRLEGGLCDLLVREVEGEPGALPLLSHVLRMTWGRREGSTLTVAGYHATGGVRHAVAQSAESLYDGLDDAGREHLRALCLRLVLPADDGDPVRARVPRRKVVLDRAHEKLVESLVAARLVTSDEGDLQIAHESLAREWPRLRSWLEEDVEGQRIFGHLASAAEWWEAKGRPDSELYRGVRLAGAADWAGRGSAELTEVERDFLDASVELEERENRAAHQQLAQQRRANRRLRELLVGVAALLVVALVASFLAARQTSRARDEASSARAATRSADAHRVGLLSADDKDLPRSLLLALEANRLHDDPETRDRLSAALTREPRLVRTLALEDLEGVALSPDGSRALAVGPGDDPGALMVEVASGATVAHNEDSFSQVSWLDRSTVAVGRDYGPGLPAKPEALVLLDAATLAPLAHQLRGQPAHTSLNGGLAASADGRYVAGVFDHVQSDGTIDRNQVLAWDRRRPDRPMFRLTLYNAQIGGIDNRGHVFVGTGGRRTITSYDGASRSARGQSHGRGPWQHHDQLRRTRTGPAPARGHRRRRRGAAGRAHPSRDASLARRRRDPQPACLLPRLEAAGDGHGWRRGRSHCVGFRLRAPRGLRGSVRTGRPSPRSVLPRRTQRDDRRCTRPVPVGPRRRARDPAHPARRAPGPFRRADGDLAGRQQGRVRRLARRCARPLPHPGAGRGHRADRRIVPVQEGPWSQRPAVVPGQQPDRCHRRRGRVRPRRRREQWDDHARPGPGPPQHSGVVGLRPWSVRSRLRRHTGGAGPDHTAGGAHVPWVRREHHSGRQPHGIDGPQRRQAAGHRPRPRLRTPPHPPPRQ